ncbi:BatA domain-containing protein [Cellulophaga sp. HaHaR_3_176]|uniref:BatA domain-containing protein n=1 Tax=Cellulophaga sp. HaHaR_3_176 TaxID=1942464 RepID=UPI001C1FAD1C|nr:BatA domain-containing protein [Cellulophaga sp. HaHaR_3_176]QWX85396.1 BatA domain-containing protein [Cellulophaga sp. HaHaR_3_176]
MQFKNPEILWALLLLIIPILIHLFQLRRFKKTPFTNVKMLQKVIAESRKTKSIKKWLLLFTRLLLFTALIIAFAQPFFAKETALLEKETVIYLDNSFSMQAKKGNTSLLEQATQELLKNISYQKKITVFTNDKTFLNTTLKDIQSDLLTLPFSKKQLALKEVKLKAETLFSRQKNTVKNLILISDFQKTDTKPVLDTTKTIQTHIIQLRASKLVNIAVDSIYVSKDLGETLEITTNLSSSSAIENTPVSIYNAEKLIAKTSAIFNDKNKATITFTIAANETILGKILISDKGLDYDNHFYFSINKKDKIKVLSIGETTTTYLNKIFTDAEFEYTNNTLKAINYSSLQDKNLIIINELENIPEVLQQALIAFTKNGGTVAVIPSINSNSSSYNSLLRNYSSKISQKVNYKQEITTINFDHPLYRNVFDKKVQNFQYPEVESYFRINTKKSSILSFVNKEPFLVGNKGFYLFTSSLSGSYSNFKNSPLIVPTFYKMGLESLQQENLYSSLNTSQTIDVAIKLPKDEVLKISKKDFEFIPQQRPFANKVSLYFNEELSEDGNYNVINNTEKLKNISFNYPRTESKLQYQDIQTLHATSKQESISELFKELEKDDRVNELWKWFVILALVFALIEIGIQKIFK